MCLSICAQIALQFFDFVKFYENGLWSFKNLDFSCGVNFLHLILSFNQCRLKKTTALPNSLLQRQYGNIQPPNCIYKKKFIASISQNDIRILTVPLTSNSIPAFRSYRGTLFHIPQLAYIHEPWNIIAFLFCSVVYKIEKHFLDQYLYVILLLYLH